MSRRRTLTRGGFVGALLGGLAAAGAGLQPWRALVERDRLTPELRLARVLHDRAAARAIGAEFVRARPGEASAAALVRAVGRRVPGGVGALTTASDAEVRALLAERSRRDFADGKTVTLRGWILSETEGRLCALAFLAAAVSPTGRPPSEPAR